MAGVGGVERLKEESLLGKRGEPCEGKANVPFGGLRTVCRSLHEHHWLALLVALALVRGALYATVVPPWQSPDETGHFEYVWLLAHLRRIPTWANVSPGFEGQLIDSLYQWRFGDYLAQGLPADRPERLDGFPLSIAARRARTVAAGRFSLAYLVQALVTVPLLHKGIEAQLYAARLSSVLLNAWIVAVAYLVCRELVPREPGTALLAAAIVLLNPQHTFINATVGDGTLAEAGAALVIYGWVRVFSRRFSALEGIAIAVGTVIANLSKNTAVFLIVADGALVLWWAGRHRRGGWRSWQVAVLAAMLLLLVGGLWLWLGSALGDRAVSSLGRLTVPLDRWTWVDQRGMTLGQALLVSHDSMWANFGWMNLPLSNRWYGALLGGSILALVGWIVGARTRTRLEPVAWAPAMMLLLLAVALGVYVWVALLGRDGGLYQFQGRYLFPAIVPWAYLLAGGWTRLTGGRRGALLLAVGGLVLLDAWAMAMYIVPYYYG